MNSFAELRAAAIDGRTHNVYYRQHQLEALHQAILDNASKIKEAVAADYDHSPAEIAVELYLALASLKREYDSLQPSQMHSNEYLLADGENAPANRAPVGIVYIEPCAHTLLFSIIAPLSAAIAAGNCVIVLVRITCHRTIVKKTCLPLCAACEQLARPHQRFASDFATCATSRHIRDRLFAYSRPSHTQFGNHCQPE